MRYCATTVLFCLLFAISGCSLQSIAHGSAPVYRVRTCLTSPQGDCHRIYVVNLGWHTGIAIASAELTAPLRQLLPESASSPWLEFGWGDRDFYMGSGYSWLGAVHAALFSSGSVMHIAGVTSPPQFFADADVTELKVSAAGFIRLQETILSTLALDDRGALDTLGKSLYGDGHFYRAHGSFSLVRTCNSWASSALADAGCAVHRNRMRASSVSKDLEKLPPA